MKFNLMYNFNDSNFKEEYKNIEKIKTLSYGHNFIIDKYNISKSDEFIVRFEDDNTMVLKNMFVLEGFQEGKLVFEVAISKSYIKSTREEYKTRYGTNYYYIYFNEDIKICKAEENLFVNPEELTLIQIHKLFDS